MKYLLICLLLIASQCINAKTVSNYEDLYTALKQGSKAYVVIDTSKCQPGPDNTAPIEHIRTLGVRINDLFEVIGVSREGKKMRMIATGSSGLFGNKNFYWTRDLLRVVEDNTIDYISDLVDPRTFGPHERIWLVCRLSNDASGGVTINIKDA